MHYSIDVSGVKRAPLPRPLTLCIQPRKTTNIPAAKAAARSNTCSLYTSHGCQPSVIRLTFFFFCGCFSASRLLLDLSHGFLWKARGVLGIPSALCLQNWLGDASHIHTAYNLRVILHPPFMVLFSLVCCCMVSTIPMSKMHLQGTVELKVHVPKHIVWTDCQHQTWPRVKFVVCRLWAHCLLGPLMMFLMQLIQNYFVKQRDI